MRRALAWRTCEHVAKNGTAMTHFHRAVANANGEAAVILAANPYEQFCTAGRFTLLDGTSSLGGTLGYFDSSTFASPSW
jgi:hypothetical protein